MTCIVDIFEYQHSYAASPHVKCECIIYRQTEFDSTNSRDGGNQNVSIPFSVLFTLKWRHNERDFVSNHQPHDCSPAARLFTFIQALIIENIEAAPRHWPLWEEFTGDRWIPRTKGQLRGKCFHLMTSSWDRVFTGGPMTQLFRWGPSVWKVFFVVWEARVQIHVEAKPVGDMSCAMVPRHHGNSVNIN